MKKPHQPRKTKIVVPIDWHDTAPFPVAVTVATNATR